MKKSTIKIINPNKREIELEISSDEVMNEFEEIVSQFSSKAKMPGFRPGKAPKNIVKQRFFAEIKETLINALVPKALNSELKAQKFKVIGTPVVSELHFREGQPLRLKAQFEIWPEFKLPEYKKIKVKKKKISITDQEINQSLEELRLRAAEYIPVEGRGVVDGDYVIIELKGKDLKTNKLLPTEKAVILCGHPDNNETLNKTLMGLKPGNESNFILDYDKNDQNKKLAGKKIDYSLKILSIKEKKIPQVNDDFAKDLGEYENLEDLKEKIKKELLTVKENEATQELGRDILKEISSKMIGELPETLVQQEYMAILNNLLSSRSSQEINKEELEQLKSEGKRKAEENIRNHFILKKIAENESIDVTDEEIHEEFKAIAKANNVPLAKVIDGVNKEGKRDEFKNNLILKKTVDFLLKHAIIE